MSRQFDREAASEYLANLFGDNEGTAAFSSKGKDGAWEEQSFAWPAGRTDALAWVKRTTPLADVFVCPALRSSQAGNRVKGEGIHLQWLWADVDWLKVPESRRDQVRSRIADLGTYVVRSGSGRNVHVYVRLDRPVSASEFHWLNTGLRDYLYADNKHPDSSLLRVAGTVNWKTPDGRPVGVGTGHGNEVSTATLAALQAWINVRRTRAGGSPDADWKPVRIDRLPRKLRALGKMSTDEALGRRYGGPDRQRYVAVNNVTKDLIKAGLTLNQIHTIMNDFPPGVEKREDENFAYDIHKDIARIWAANHDALTVDDQPVMEESPGQEPVRAVRLVKASSFKIKRVQWGWQDRMPVGELCLIPGREGSGKSMFLAWLAAQITTGRLPGVFYGQPRPVAYVANEDAWEYTIAPRMLAAGADLDLVYNVEVADENEFGLRLPRDCGEVGERLREVGAAALMLDPIVSVIDDRISVNQSRELRQALEPLRRMAERAQVMVPALAHFNKAAVDDVLSKIPGARAWAEVARAAIGIAKDEDEDVYVASQIKNNLGRLDMPHLTYTIESAEVAAEDGPTDVGRLVWGEDSERSVQELLDKRSDKRGRNASDTTKRILMHVLDSPGALTVADVQGALPDIKPDTVARSLIRLAARSELVKTGRGLYGRPRIVSGRD